MLPAHLYCSGEGLRTGMVASSSLSLESSIRSKVLREQEGNTTSHQQPSTTVIHYSLKSQPFPVFGKYMYMYKFLRSDFEMGGTGHKC